MQGETYLLCSNTIYNNGAIILLSFISLSFYRLFETMKLEHVLLLFSALSSLFLVVYSDGQQDFDNCHKACTIEFRPIIANLLTLNRTYSDYENVIPYWTTCQYRCYRCSLPNANFFMDLLKKIFDDEEQNGLRVILEIVKLIAGIETSLKECYDKWTAANRVGDTTSSF